MTSLHVTILTICAVMSTVWIFFIMSQLGTIITILRGKP